MLILLAEKADEDAENDKLVKHDVTVDAEKEQQSSKVSETFHDLQSPLSLNPDIVEHIRLSGGSRRRGGDGPPPLVKRALGIERRRHKQTASLPGPE
jgi:hypothetical protein